MTISGTLRSSGVCSKTGRSSLSAHQVEVRELTRFKMLLMRMLTSRFVLQFSLGRKLLIHLLRKVVDMNTALGQVLVTLLITVLNNPQLQDELAEPIAKVLTDALPDVTEDAIGNFLILLGTKVKDANP